MERLKVVMMLISLAIILSCCSKNKDNIPDECYIQCDIFRGIDGNLSETDLATKRQSLMDKGWSYDHKNQTYIFIKNKDTSLSFPDEMIHIYSDHELIIESKTERFPIYDVDGKRAGTIEIKALSDYWIESTGEHIYRIDINILDKESIINHDLILQSICGSTATITIKQN